MNITRNMNITRAYKLPTQSGYYWCIVNGSPILVEVFLMPNDKIEDGRFSPVMSQAGWTCHYFQSPRTIGETLPCHWSELIQFSPVECKCDLHIDKKPTVAETTSSPKPKRFTIVNTNMEKYFEDNETRRVLSFREVCDLLNSLHNEKEALKEELEKAKLHCTLDTALTEQNIEQVNRIKSMVKILIEQNDNLKKELAQVKEERDQIQETLTSVEGEVAKVYCHFTGSKISKCNTLSFHVIDAIEEYMELSNDKQAAPVEKTDNIPKEIKEEYEFCKAILKTKDAPSLSEVVERLEKVENKLEQYFPEVN